VYADVRWLVCARGNVRWFVLGWCMLMCAGWCALVVMCAGVRWLVCVELVCARGNVHCCALAGP